MFACIYIPDFPVEAIVRAKPLLRERAVAVLEGKSPLTRVIALNEKARLLGMETGMTKLQAAIFAAPEAKGPAVLHQRSLDQENSAHSALLDVAHAFTPQVEDTATDTLLLDLAGLERLYGAPAKMARNLASRVIAVGLEASTAIAANPDAAMHAARGFGGTTVIPTGKEAQRLGVLPLQVLLDAFAISPQKNSAADRERGKQREQMLDTLERWGVRDFRTLAQLPDHALASRLGEAGTRLQRLARGAGMRTLALCAPPSRFEEAMALEPPVETLEPLSFILNRLLEQLCARLETRALAAQELRLRLQLERRVADEDTTTVRELEVNSHIVGWATFERTLRLPVAMRDTKVLLKLLQLDLAAHPPGAPVIKVWITAEPAPPRSAQRGLFLPITPEAEKLEITLARISGVVGERRAGIVHLLDTHRQDSFRMERFVTAPEETKQAEHPTTSDIEAHPQLALRMFRPPWQLRVRVAEGRPVSVSSLPIQKDRGELQGKVWWSAGPWRSSGDWWAENAEQGSAAKDQARPWDREEWDVALANGNGKSVALYRIYRDLGNGRWFADVSYD
jgi:protein ImuB